MAAVWEEAATLCGLRCMALSHVVRWPVPWWTEGSCGMRLQICSCPAEQVHAEGILIEG